MLMDKTMQVALNDETVLSLPKALVVREWQHFTAVRALLKFR
jgi:hypothetical protein